METVTTELAKEKRPVGKQGQSKKRNPSPEELSVMNDPKVTVRVANLEAVKEQGKAAPAIEFSWGGAKWVFIEGKEYKVPLGLVRHIKEHCQTPIYAEVPDPENPGSTVCKKISSTSRFAIEPINYGEMAKAEAEMAAKEKKKE